MTRIRIIIPVATIEQTKLYLIRGAVLLLCVLIFPLAAHASPFDTGISSIQTLFTGTIAKAATRYYWLSCSQPNRSKLSPTASARVGAEAAAKRSASCYPFAISRIG